MAVLAQFGRSPVVAALAVNLIGMVARAQQLTYLNSWGSAGNGDGQFDIPDGVAVAPDGTVYVADASNHSVQYFSPTGAYQGTTTGIQLSSPYGVAAGADGTIYVGDLHQDIVQLFTASGSYQSTIGSGDQNLYPSGLAARADGTIYVAFEYASDVNIYSSTGAYQDSFGSLGGSYSTQGGGGGDGQFSFAQGVAVGTGGLVYVADGPNPAPNYTGVQDNRIQVFSATGTFQNTFGSYGGGDGQFSNPVGVAAGPTGIIYVVDSGNNRLETFTSSGVFQISVGSYGDGDGQFNAPQFVAVAPTGMVYVTDSGNNRVERFFDPASWVSGTNTFTDPTTGPTSVAVGVGGLLGTEFTLAAAMGLTVGGSTAVSNGGSLTVSGGSLTTSGLVIDGSHGGAEVDMTGGVLSATSIVVQNGASFELDGAATLADAPSLTVQASVEFHAGSNGIVNRTIAALSLDAGGKLTLSSAAAQTNRTLLQVSSVIFSGGLLDLGANDLIVHNGNFAEITAQIAQGFNGGHWSGNNGITSSSAASAADTALGIESNQNGAGGVLLSIFDGQSVVSSDVLVKYTYFGDANLDGVVNGSDYTLIDNGFNSRLVGWRNGDFNYDGVVNGDDYTLIDNAFNTQGASLAASANAAIAVSPSSIPEPTALACCGLGAAALLARRRGRRCDRATGFT